ncbi:MAG: hypothetical protein LUI05_07045 [Oscillospiraceae bacterium]|nr:hypothetical protein [Oscillospiraceae bacterium]
MGAELKVTLGKDGESHGDDRAAVFREHCVWLVRSIALRKIAEFKGKAQALHSEPDLIGK